MASLAKHSRETSLSLPEAQDAYNDARIAQQEVEADDERFLRELKVASQKGDHAAVMEARSGLDNIGIRRWSTDLAATRAYMNLVMAERAAATSERIGLVPRLQELDRKLQELHEERNKVVGIMQNAQGTETYYNQTIGDLRRKIEHLEHSEAAYAPPMRSIQRRRA